ncbi:hypothetical protein [Alkalicoccobacillus murimartini]|uniref:Uncharacterized protein n=1 Tax=Alkalicoccobacillus murimartini TaxID=171685 RepID=A0ABT9YMA8_9BACI|nr:hypothetical protein [Alkalicoccobacillus murimartini]MDQ0208636.1 hypothetical protein [Alkalicoccobacillus murimartini]
MKWFGIFLSICVISLAAFLFITKSYYFYPALPIENLSARTVIDTFNRSDDEVAQIAELDDYIWYLTESNKEEGFGTSDKNIKQLIQSRGWDFKEKVGSAFFFEKANEELIITTQMWTEQYVLVQAQNKFKEL